MKEASFFFLYVTEHFLRWIRDARATLMQIEMKLDASQVSIDICALILFCSLCCISLFFLRSRKAYIKAPVLAASAVILIILLSIVPLMMLVRIIATAMMLFILFRITFFRRSDQYKRPELEEDHMGRLAFYMRGVSHIRKLMARYRGCGGMTVAVYGEWGSGKSHFLRFIERNLAVPEKASDVCVSGGFSGKVPVAKVDLWQTHSLTEAWEQIANALCAAMKGRQSAWRHSPMLMKCLKSISALQLNIAPLAYLLYDFLSEGENDREGVQKISQMIQSGSNDGFAVLFLDNVERCDVEVIIKLLPLLERLKQIRNLVVIAAISREDLVSRLEVHGYHEKQVHGILNKLFDHVLQMPPCNRENMQSMFSHLVNHYHSDCPTLMHFAKRNKLIPCSTPRDAERIVNHLADIDSQYLSRYSDKLEDTAWMERYETVFYMEILRLYNSPAYHFLRNKENPYLFLKTAPFHFLYSDDSLGPMLPSDSERELTQEEQEWKDANQSFLNLLIHDEVSKKCLYEISHKLNDDFSYAFQKEYTSLIALGEAESLEIEKRVLYSGLAVPDAIFSVINQLYPNCRETEKKQLLEQCVMMAAARMDSVSSGRFVCRAFRTCFSTLQEMNYPDLVLQILYNRCFYIGKHWRYVEMIVLETIPYKAICKIYDIILNVWLTDIVRQQKYTPRIGRIRLVGNTIDLMERLCRKMISGLLKQILNMGAEERTSAYSCDYDCKLFFRSYYEDEILKETPKLIKGMDNARVLEKIINSFYCYEWRYNWPDPECFLMVSETYFSIILYFMEQAAILSPKSIAEEHRASIIQQIELFCEAAQDQIEHPRLLNGHHLMEASYQKGLQTAESFFAQYAKELSQNDSSAD